MRCVGGRAGQRNGTPSGAAKPETRAQPPKAPNKGLAKPMARAAMPYREQALGSAWQRACERMRGGVWAYPMEAFEGMKLASASASAKVVICAVSICRAAETTDDHFGCQHNNSSFDALTRMHRAGRGPVACSALVASLFDGERTVLKGCFGGGRK